MDQQGLQEKKLDWFITEYQALRGEINGRSREQFICIVGSITFLGSILAFVSNDPNTFSPLLIVIPWILGIFGFIWTDHSHHIFLLGSYIRERIEPRMSEKGGWQNYIHAWRKRQGGKPSFIVLWLPILYFVLPSVGSIIAYILLRIMGITEIPLPIEIILLVVGIVLLFGVLRSWNRAMGAILE